MLKKSRQMELQWNGAVMVRASLSRRGGSWTMPGFPGCGWRSRSARWRNLMLILPSMLQDGSFVAGKDVNKLESLPTKKQLIGKIAGSIKQITTKIPLGIKQVTAKVGYGARVRMAQLQVLRKNRVPVRRYSARPTNASREPLLSACSLRGLRCLSGCAVCPFFLQELADGKSDLIKA